MACVLSGGYQLPCRLPAGIQAFYVGSWTSNLAYTLGTASGAGGNLNQITTFTAGTSSMYTFLQDSEVGGVTNNGNVNVQNGSAYMDQIIEFSIHNPSQTIIDQTTILSQGRVRVIALDQNGNYFLFGLKNPMNMSALAGGLGKAYGDLYGYTITITGKEIAVATQITTAAALSVIS